MTLTETLNKSVSNLIVLVEVDISQINLQWINAGAGIWKVNAEGIYSEVDSSLLTGFTAQEFGYIGSVYVDGNKITRVDSVSEVADITRSFYYDATDRTLYVTIINYDEPFLHTIHIGVIYPYSYENVIISDFSQQVQGRLLAVPGISISRDPLFWGKLSYDAGAIRLINADGTLDGLGEDNNLYGNECRVKVGSPNSTYDDFLTFAIKYIETVNISEENTTINLIDRRKILSKRIRYSCTNKNGVEAIQEILTTYLGYIYSTTYFETTEWTQAITDSANVTIKIDEQDANISEEAITIIQWICSAIFGVFYLTDDDKFSCKIVDTNKGAIDTILNRDILNRHRINYDPSEVISSVQVGYAKNWADATYSYYTDDSQEQTVYGKYKVYREHQIETVLPDLESAEAYTDTLLDYSQDTHGTFSIQVPLKYYDIEIGDNINVEITRQTNDMLGFKKCEVMGKRYDFDNLGINLDLRIISDSDTILLTEDDFYFMTEDDCIIVLE